MAASYCSAALFAAGLVTLSTSLVTLSETKDPRIPLRVNSTKGLFHFKMLRFFAGAQNDRVGTPVADRRYGVPSMILRSSAVMP